jgi:putative nucleotidyltransferase with HDIG domain
VVVLASSIVGILMFFIMKDGLNDNFIQNIKMINNRILSTVSNADYITYLHEKPLEAEGMEVLNKVKKKYEEQGNINFSLAPFQDTNSDTQIYIINTENKVISTTDSKDMGLDFTEFPYFSSFLDKVREAGSFDSSRVSLSILEGDMKKYCYLPSDDGKYIFETGAIIGRDETFANSIGLDNFEQKIVADDEIIQSAILYDYTGVSYQKNGEGNNYSLENSQRVYFNKAISTLETIEVRKKYKDETLYYYYIPYEIIGAKGSNERNVIEVIYTNTDMNRLLENSVFIIILLVAFGSITAGTIGFHRAKSITRPIEAISEGVKQIGEGNFNLSVLVNSNDEFSQLANQFEVMGNEISKLLEERKETLSDLEFKNKEISAQKEEIESLYEETISINEELENLLVKNKMSYFETVRTLANAIEEKDRYTGGHCERVMEYSMKIANELGLNEDEKNDLKFGSILHDIGKIGIPEAILHKDDKLTTDEYSIIKTHPEIGHRILKNLDFLNHSKSIVYEHHERMDGKGYPRGLKGNEIHLLARIVCVADAFDAMTSNRPYKSVMTTEKAVKELLDNAGTQFDPEIVEAFIKAITKN